ncbi:MAG: hypothetical protein K2K39_01890 [Clostridia bacterium]|nr:hypothetical protein [Clostridia bacterium]
MEEICASLSARLCEAGTGGYKIYYEEELAEALPEEMRNRETLEAALKNLAGGGYIDVKYARGSAFCICTYKKYEAPKKETAEDATAAEVKTETFAADVKFYIAAALSAFAGAAAGGGLIAILGLVF